MIKMILAEFEKSRRSMIYPFMILVPGFLIALSYFLGGGQVGAYNWWYVMFLPSLIPLLAAMVVNRDKKIQYKTIFLYPNDKAKFWIAKTIFLSLIVGISSLVFIFGIMILGYFDGYDIFLKADFLGGMILFLTCLFQIPICMYLVDQFNLFFALVFNNLMIMISVVFFETSSMIGALPYGVGINLMCPILHILPNGLTVPEGSVLLLNNHYVLPILECLLLFIILVAITGIVFRRREEK